MSFEKGCSTQGPEHTRTCALKSPGSSTAEPFSSATTRLTASRNIWTCASCVSLCVKSAVMCVVAVTTRLRNDRN